MVVLWSVSFALACKIFPFCFADLELYNESLKILNDFPQYYPFEVSLSG